MSSPRRRAQSPAPIASPATPAAPAGLSAPVPAQTLADQAYARLKALIFDFSLMPGDRFVEAEMCERLAVSRTPLRQALQRLERDGFVQVSSKIGWQVSPLDFDTFDELYDLRVLIEAHAARALSEAQDRPALAALAEVWLVPEAERETDPVRVGEADERFHAELVAASGNREMLRVHRELTERIRIIRRLDFTKPDRVSATYDEHARILRAITRRRPDEAQRLLTAHITQSKLEVRHITLDMLWRARRAS